MSLPDATLLKPKRPVGRPPTSTDRIRITVLHGFITKTGGEIDLGRAVDLLLVTVEVPEPEYLRLAAEAG